MNATIVTVSVVSAVMVAAVAIHAGLAELIGRPADTSDLVVAGAVSILIAGPITLLAQRIIRELLESRQSLRLMTEQLAWAVHNAEQANDAKSTFLATMSHELRTPLNAIIGFSEMMSQEKIGPIGDPRYREYSGHILSSGNHLLSIINDILDIAKIEAGQTTVDDQEESRLSHVIHTATTMVRPLANKRGIRLQHRLPDGEVLLVAVERMIVQVLVNLLSNATKFTSRGGIVDLAVTLLADGRLLITVADTGIGMSQDDIRIALTPFGQVGESQNHEHPGTGLGLPLAKSMVELHDGQLTIDSTPGEGTTVRLVFPAERVSYREQPRLAAG